MDEARKDQLFQTALREKWNREMDWLWLATVVGQDSQKRVYFEHALRINPQSVEARSALEQLSVKPSAQRRESYRSTTTVLGWARSVLANLL